VSIVVLWFVTPCNLSCNLNRHLDRRENLNSDIILSVVLYGFKAWSLILREGHKLKVFENRMLRVIFEPERMKVTECCRFIIYTFCQIVPG
jgi:hypothetical protein